jgi:hypothetical protein
MSRPATISLFFLLLAGPARAEPAGSVAGSVVRSKEWVVRRGKAREEEFIGDVHYDAAGTKLSADWALYRQGPNDWRARGNIYARREFAAGDVLETWGEKAWHDQNTLKGRLEPAGGVLIPILRTPLKGAPDHAEGEHLSWIGESVGVLTGRAHGWGPRDEFWADAARYDHLRAIQTLTLSGSRPAVHEYAGGKDAAVKADRIVAFDSPRRAIATGRAMGWILSQSSAAPTGADTVRCGQGDRSEGPGADARVSALLSPLGPGRSTEEEGRFWEAESAAFTARACPWSARLDFWADKADYAELPDRRVTLTGGRPVLRKLEEESSVAIKGDRVVAFAFTRRIEAEGKVKGWLVFKEEKKRTKEKKQEKAK